MFAVLIKLLFPNVTKIIPILIIILIKNNSIELSLINNKNMEEEATKLPNTNLLIGTISFKILQVPYSNKKSKKKFSKNTKSKYTFIYITKLTIQIKKRLICRF